MKKGLIFLLFFCFPLFAEDISKENKPITIKVLLAKLANESHIEVRGRYLIYNPKTDDLITSGSKKKRGKIYISSKGLTWGDFHFNNDEIRIVPNEPKSAILVNGIQYKGCLEVYNIGGTINIINEVDVENFLKSTLAAKITDRVSKETLDAIAITERTNLYYFLQKNAYASWQVEAEKADYLGYGAAKQNSSVQESVERTRDMILNYQNVPFPTTWSFNLAGKSVAYSSVYRKSATLPNGVNHLPSLHRRDKAKWRFTIPLKNLAEIFECSSIHQLALFKAEKTEKVYGIRVKGPKGKKDFDFFTLQKLFGKNFLPSNDFSISIRGNKAFFYGYGKGEGVGLCVTSAELMAKRKKGVKDILSNHFPETKLVNIREEVGQTPNTSFIWK